jgi:TolB protein
MDADGSNMRMITRTSNSKFDPCWSPDSTTISFTVEKLGRMANLFQVDSDGGNLRRLTAGPRFDDRPVYSPDGSKLAFVSNRDGNAEIYVLTLR